MKFKLTLGLSLMTFAFIFANQQTIEQKKEKLKYDWYSTYDVKFYKLDIQVNDTTTYIDGNVSILSEITASRLDTFCFELYAGIHLDSVYLIRKKVSFTRSGDVVKVKLPNAYKKGQLLDITIFYNGSVPSQGFFSPVTSQKDGRWKVPVTWTLSEPLGAKYWFPCKQCLPDKADSAWIFITVPKRCKAGSNGLLTNIKDVSTDKVRYEWKTRFPIAYYLISFAVADYRDYSFYTRLNGKDSVLVQNFIYNRPEVLETNKGFIDQTDDFLKFFSSLYGTYPFKREKYGHCLAPMGGGMEHQTMTTLSSFDPSIVSHELAHQWFGDLVSCANWQDIWVNEGFASYSEYLAKDKLSSHDDATQWMNIAHRYALRENSGSVFVPWEDRENDFRIFSYSLTYKKGASIIHLLRYELNNDSLFFDILRNYLNQFKGSVATAEDFMNVVNRRSGKNFEWFLNEWYYGKGFPEFDIAWNQQKDTLSLFSAQSPSVASGPFFTMHFDLKLTYQGGDSIVRLFQDKPRKTFKLYLKKSINQVTFDPGEWLLCKAIVDSVADLPSANDYFYVSPYSFSGELVVKFRNTPESGNRKIRITDINGRVLKELNPHQQMSVTLKTEDLPSGRYFVCVDDAKKVYKKLVIKNPE